MVSDPAKQVLERHEKRDRREEWSRCLDERDDLPTTDRLKGQRISYLKYFTIDPTLNLTIICANLMVNLVGRRSIWRPSLTDIYSCSTPPPVRGYDTVSTSSFTIQRSSKPIRESCFCSGCLLGADLIDGQTSSTCMISRAAVALLIFASFVVYSMYYSILARLR